MNIDWRHNTDVVEVHGAGQAGIVHGERLRAARAQGWD